MKQVRAITSGPKRSYHIAFTFDDGPTNWTYRVADAFSSVGGKATFFFVGNRVPACLPSCQRIHQQGHEIASHTWSHVHLSKSYTTLRLLHELQQPASSFPAWGLGTPRWVRALQGVVDEAGWKVIHRTTYNGRVVNWNSTGRDTFNWGYSAEQIAEYVVATMRPGGIVCLHDTNAKTIEAVPAILEVCKARGLEPVTVTRLLTPGGVR